MVSHILSPEYEEKLKQEMYRRVSDMDIFVSVFWKEKTAIMKEESYNNVRFFIEQTQIDIEQVFTLVKNNTIKVWSGSSGMSIPYAVDLCKKLDIPFDLVPRISFDLSHNFSFLEMMMKSTISLNEEALAFLQDILWKDAFREIMITSVWLKEAYESLSDEEELFVSQTPYKEMDSKRLHLLSLLFDVQITHGPTSIIINTIFKERIDSSPPDWIKENIFFLWELIHFSLHHITDHLDSLHLDMWDLENTLAEKYIVDKEYMLSPKNIVAFMKEKHHTYKEDRIIEIFKDHISIDANYLCTWELNSLNIQETITTIISPEIDDRYTNTLRYILAKEYKRESYTLPSFFDTYKEWYLEAHKKEVFRWIFDLTKQKVFSWIHTKNEKTFFSHLKAQTPHYLSQLHVLLQLIKDIIGVHDSYKDKLYDLLDKLWVSIYNRPFATQKLFYALSNKLLSFYPEHYHLLLQIILSISRKKRKEFVDETAPLLEFMIDFYRSMHIEEPRSTDDIAFVLADVLSSHKTSNASCEQVHILLDRILLSVNENWFSVEALKQTFQEEIMIFKQSIVKDFFCISHENKYMDHEYADPFLTYWLHLSQKNKENLIVLGGMFSAHVNKVRTSRRVDKRIILPDISLEGQELLAPYTDESETKYWEQYLSLQELKNLQTTTSLQGIIQSKTPSEVMFGIQESFEELFDPDIYRQEDKDLFEALYRKSWKKEIIKKIGMRLWKTAEEISERLPILGFIERIEQLDLSTIAPHAYEKTFQEAKLLFAEITLAFKAASAPETAQIRIEDIANNFSCEVDEVSRSIAAWLDIHTSTPIVSKVSTHMPDIIKNIRWCLWCMTKNSQNHQNLDFIHPNRFLIITRKDQDDEKEGLSDQLCILLPSDQWLCFVMDRVYWIRSSKILINHCLSVIKKLDAAQNKDIKIFLTNVSIQSVGMTAQTFIKQVKDTLLCTPTQITVDKTYLWYQEFCSSDATPIKGMMIEII